MVQCTFEGAGTTLVRDSILKEGYMATARMPQPTADDPVEVDPKHYQVEFENDRVRVLRIKYGPGEKSVMHSHPESIAVFLTDIHAKFTYPDGRTEDINANAGTVQHMDAFTHLPESTSKTPFEVIAVELKD
jgi:quercetin dioxygenase-like cupin family protein